MFSYGRGQEEKMSRNVYDEWNEDGTLPKIKPCPFCGSAGVLNDNGYETPVIDPSTGAYIDMDIREADGFWCECPECGAILPGADTPEGAIEQWNRRDDPPNDPLTLAELRGLEGDPVWVEHCNGGEWVVVAWNIYDEIAGSRQARLAADNYGVDGLGGWLAYRHRVREDDQ